MSRVEDLLDKMCPDGVRFKPIGEVTTRGNTIRWAMAGEDGFKYIDLTSVDRVTKRIGETATITADTAPSRAQQVVHAGDVIFATTRPAQMRWAVITNDFHRQIASTGYCVLRPKHNAILTNYLAHVLGGEEFRQYVEVKQVPGNYPSIPDRLVRAFRIPVPPLEVQREIVRILDTFTELEAELKAELEARRRQYAYYRERLFQGLSGSRVYLGQVGEFIRGRRFTWKDVVDVGIPAIHYSEIYTQYGVAADTASIHVRSELARQLRFANPGDVVIAGVGETVEDLAKAVAWIGADPVAIHDDTFLYRSDVNPKFVAYWLQTDDFHSQKSRHVARAKVKRISSAGLAQVVIPVPDAAEQERVVAILDSFDALVNDLSIGLPAELAARRKQYEFYRDRLLTFEEAV